MSIQETVGALTEARQRIEEAQRLAESAKRMLDSAIALTHKAYGDLSSSSVSQMMQAANSSQTELNNAINVMGGYVNLINAKIAQVTS